MNNLCAGISAALCSVVLLTACGGGGGGSGAPAAPAAGVPQVKPAAVGLSVVKLPVVSGDHMIGNHWAAPLPKPEIEVDVTGDLAALSGKQVYVLVNDPHGVFNRAVLLQDSVTRYRLALYYESATYGATDYDMPVGDFNASVQVAVCLDAQCNQPFAGSPIFMPYRYKIEPGLALQGFGPGLPPLALSSTPSTAVVKDVAVTLPPRTTNWSVEDNGGSGGVKFTAVGPTTLRIEGAAVGAGSYYGNFIVRATATTPQGERAEFLSSGSVSYVVR